MNRRCWIKCLVALTCLAASTTACLPWQRPAEGDLVYNGPTERGIAAGQLFPGTDIRYVAPGEDSAIVLIGGQRAHKKIGDSLDWDGSPMDGVTLRLTQRIVWFTEETLHAAGTARLTIEDVQPVPGAYPEEVAIAYKLPTTHNVAAGEVIPGTTLTYVGATNDGAQLSGVDGYPYRKIADSITWEGRLRDGVFVQLTLRVVFYDQRQLQVAGLATIDLVPSQAPGPAE
jgi:hypothetical protein